MTAAGDPVMGDNGPIQIVGALSRSARTARYLSTEFGREDEDGGFSRWRRQLEALGQTYYSAPANRPNIGLRPAFSKAAWNRRT